MAPVFERLLKADTCEPNRVDDDRPFVEPRDDEAEAIGSRAGCLIFLHADESLQKRGAGLVAVEDPIDMTSPRGRAFAVMLAVFGEMEAEAIRARVRAARAQLLKDGRWAGGGIPYGYRSTANPDGPGRVLVKDPERIAGSRCRR